MRNEEKLLRVSLIGTFLSFYHHTELTRAGNKLKKKARVGLKSLSNKVGISDSIWLIKSLDPKWEEVFVKHKGEVYLLAGLILGVWKEDIDSYIPDKLMEKFSYSEMHDLNEEGGKLEIKTFDMIDEFETIIKQVLLEFDEKKKEEA